MKIDLKCPVENRGSSIKTSTKTNENYALLKLYNLSDEKITEVELTAKVYDTYGKELGNIPVTLTSLDAAPKSFFAQNKAILLDGFAEAKHVSAEFRRIAFENGSEYIPDGSFVDVTLAEPDSDEADKLKETAGSDAVCYAKDPGEYWVCVCGRVNTNDTESCVRCGREKKLVLDKFSSRQSLNLAYEEKKIADDRAELERFKAIEKAKAEKKQKLLKNTLKGAIGVLCLAVICTVIYFAYGFIATQVANIKVKNGDFLGAYKIYSSVKSSSIGKASEQVKGNSASNLNGSGILADDENNYYYIDGTMQIVIENKESGEKKETGIRGLSLNAVSGTLYYLSLDDSGKIYKLDSESLETLPVEGVEDVEAYALSVVGNDIYYMVAETVGEGQQAQQIPVLYRVKEGKKPVKMSDEPIPVFDVYKGKIYYISNDGTQSLNVISKPGATPKTLVEGPIIQFEIKDDVIYYLDYTTSQDSTDGLPNLSVNSVTLKDERTAKLTPDGEKVMAFSVLNDKIYYISYSNNMAFTTMPLNGGETTVLSEEGFNVVNVCDKMGIALNSNSEMVKINLETGETESLGNLG